MVGERKISRFHDELMRVELHGNHFGGIEKWESFISLQTEYMKFANIRDELKLGLEMDMKL